MAGSLSLDGRKVPVTDILAVFDAHCHVAPSSAGTTPGPDARVDTLLAALDLAGVRAAAVMPVPVQAGIALNPWVLALARRHPDRIVPGVLLDDRVDRWADSGARFVKEHVYGLRTRNRSEQNRPAIEACARRRLPLIAHLGGEGGDSLAAHFDAVARRVREYKDWCPSLRIVVAHAGMPFPPTGWCREWRGLLAILARLEGVWVDVSCIEEPGALRAVIGEIGAGRALFGSDFPFEPPVRSLDRVRALDLTSGQLQAVLQENAAEVFGDA